MPGKIFIVIAFVFSFLGGAAPAVSQEYGPPEQELESIGLTPPRLGYVDGRVSFWRPGAEEWTQAQVNTALAPGDGLYTASPGNLEIQIGPRAFVRGSADTQIGLENQEPDFIQFKLTTGCASFDLGTLEPGHAVEVNTPNAVFTIEHAGYYRVEVDGERTAFVVRRAGQAAITSPSGGSLSVAPNEKVVIEGTEYPRVNSYAAPPLDKWDKWNYARTDRLLSADSARYVSPETYGVSDLDVHGKWRVVPTYGSVWVPAEVPSGWAPYSTGAWMLDPYYGWTWVDTAPWGWAPYHHGRWVFVDGFWAWAPGPVAARQVYAPACVAFFGGSGAHISVSTGGPVVGWVALGWGEPLVPWWGRPGFIHRPWWGGWGGPRVVNNVVIHHTNAVYVNDINAYCNASVRNGVVVVNENRFGRGPIHSAHHRHVDVHSLRPIHSAPKRSATPVSYVPTEHRGMRPPDRSQKRQVVTTRPLHAGPDQSAALNRKDGRSSAAKPEPHIVPTPRKKESAAALLQPPFTHGSRERIQNGREERPYASKTEGLRRSEQDSGHKMHPVRQPQAQPQTPERTTPPKPENIQRPEGESGIRVNVDRQLPQKLKSRAPQRPSLFKAEDLNRPAGDQKGDKMRQELRQPRSQAEAVRARLASLRPQTQRFEEPKYQARPLLGEPHSRLSPNRSDPKPSKRKERPETPPGVSGKDRAH